MIFITTNNQPLQRFRFFFFCIYFFSFPQFFKVTGVLFKENAQDPEYPEAVLKMVKKMREGSLK